MCLFSPYITIFNCNKKNCQKPFIITLHTHNTHLHFYKPYMVLRLAKNKYNLNYQLAFPL